ncbi:hypothetical protein MPTK1_1g17700 [Marchantia polymorpha subsp. ruderalis]|uniref:Uncharacterized protein n=1 Tax=Marchantia polymorpha subsp. ruderalis TaxID=1480154 RepID=A0AAF6ARA5_MARPO|nr:hypothetical protein Mp_1g17700 [Marchantia polymorpha subsp. ruderalis]
MRSPVCPASTQLATSSEQQNRSSSTKVREDEEGNQAVYRVLYLRRMYHPMATTPPVHRWDCHHRDRSMSEMHFQGLENPKTGFNSEERKLRQHLVCADR